MPRGAEGGPQLLPAWEPVSPVKRDQQHLVSLSSSVLARRKGATPAWHPREAVLNLWVTTIGKHIVPTETLLGSKITTSQRKQVHGWGFLRLLEMGVF